MVCSNANAFDAKQIIDGEGKGRFEFGTAISGKGSMNSKNSNPASDKSFRDGFGGEVDDGNRFRPARKTTNESE